MASQCKEDKASPAPRMVAEPPPRSGLPFENEMPAAFSRHFIVLGRAESALGATWGTRVTQVQGVCRHLHPKS